MISYIYTKRDVKVIFILLVGKIFITIIIFFSDEDESDVSLGEAATTSTSATTTLEKGASTELSKSNASSELGNIFQVKWIGWRSNRVPIITQNSNGPCPMLAIANILLLRGKMELQDGCEMVSSEQLIELLGMYT